MASLPGTPAAAVLRPCRSMPVEGPKVPMEPRSGVRMPADQLLQHLDRGRSAEVRPLAHGVQHPPATSPPPHATPQGLRSPQTAPAHPQMHPQHPVQYHHQHPANMQQHPANMQQHPASLQHQHSALQNHHPASMQQHPANMQHQHPASLQHQHSANLQHQHPANMQQHPANLQHQHSANLQHQHSANLQHQHSANLQHQHSANLQHQHSGSLQHQHSGSLQHQHSGSLQHQHSQHPANIHHQSPHHVAHLSHPQVPQHPYPAAPGQPGHQGHPAPQLPVEKRRAPHQELDDHDKDLIQKLQERHLSRKNSARSSPSPKTGDRGSLSPAAAQHATVSVAQTAQTAAAKTHMAQQLEDAAQKTEMVSHQDWPELTEAALQREMAAREVELRVLRKELESRKEEIFHLENQIKDAEGYLAAKTGEVGTLSAKVEAKTEKQQAVLHASAKQMDLQVAALKKRLASLQSELLEKDEELKALHEATVHGAQAVKLKEQEHKALMEQHKEHDHQVAKLHENNQLLHRHMSIDHWRHQVQAQIEQEQHDAAMLRQRREMQRQIEVFHEEMGTLQSYVLRMEEKCRYHEDEIQRRKEHLEALVMEERLCVAAARMGQHTAEEMKKGHMEEQRSLQAKLQDHMGKQSSLANEATSYHHFEEDAQRSQDMLRALTACVKQAAQVMREHGPVHLGDVDHAISQFTVEMRRHGELIPPITRLTHTSHLVANRLTVFCELSSSGQLCVRTKAGLIPMLDFLKQHGYAQKAATKPLPKSSPVHRSHPTAASHAAPHRTAAPQHAAASPSKLRHHKTAQHAAAEAHETPHTIVHHKEGATMAV